MRVSLDLIFSYNKKIGSRLISWLTCHKNNMRSSVHTPSHVAILVNNRWIFESTFNNGVHVLSIDKWKQQNYIACLYHIGTIDYSVLADIVRSIKNKKYDYKGALFLGACLLINKFLFVPLPSKNYLENPNAYFCTEVLEMLIDKDLSMYSPAQILSMGENFVRLE